MLPEIAKIKGIHPGVVLKRELALRGLKNKELARLLNEHAQTISSVLNQKRGINPNLSIKLGKQLGVDEDYFMLLQASYDVKISQEKNKSKIPDLNKFRSVLFWDTDVNNIDWEKSRKFVIKRVFERGNDAEITEVISFYGSSTICEAVKDIDTNFLPALKHNLAKYQIVN